MAGTLHSCWSAAFKLSCGENLALLGLHIPGGRVVHNKTHQSQFLSSTVDALGASHSKLLEQRMWQQISRGLGTRSPGVGPTGRRHLGAGLIVPSPGLWHLPQGVAHSCPSTSRSRPELWCRILSEPGSQEPLGTPGDGAEGSTAGPQRRRTSQAGESLEAFSFKKMYGRGGAVRGE